MAESPRGARTATEADGREADGREPAKRVPS
jgi:hypothetical protein